MMIRTDPLLDGVRESLGIDHVLFRAEIGRETYVMADSGSLAVVRDLLPLLEATAPKAFGFDFQVIVRASGSEGGSGQLALIRRAPKSWPEAARRESQRIAEQLMSRLYEMI
ncbi:hypothetical protein ABC974_19670 [Sphingomonas oligophenolica]|uniref:Uncharacterized protein n=1 Tax=Sphingomonas oligophenolica TaxID=301154 RepID=A0ABU9Y7S9_9SPHN